MTSFGMAAVETGPGMDTSTEQLLRLALFGEHWRRNALCSPVFVILFAVLIVRDWPER
ncbi:MAG: hypothetical protein KDC38_17615 [Planctomycetes bacterium]|nr:hypothetical protein [Planctomycetota bacterium]